MGTKTGFVGWLRGGWVGREVGFVCAVWARQPEAVPRSGVFMPVSPFDCLKGQQEPAAFEAVPFAAID